MDKPGPIPLNGGATMPATVTILYATVSGNAEELARLSAARLQGVGHVTELANVADWPASRLAAAGTVLIIASTWGAGRPPPDAEEFCTALQQPPSLPALRYAVLALGSSSYPDFCACGRAIDEALEKCGAMRLLPRVDCDTKYRDGFEQWLDTVLRKLPLPA